MKTTPFTKIHQDLGAKMSPFGGFLMPIEYSGILAEHHAVCESVGVFDVSHMGEFWVRGPKALDFLQNITSNDVSALQAGQVQYAYFPNEKGGVVDDLLVHKMSDTEYLMVVNASNIDKDWEWCVAHHAEGAELDNASGRTAQLAVQGPKAILALQKLTSVNLSDISYYHFAFGTFAGVENVLISNTGYTGAGGFEIYFSPEEGLKIWNAVFEAGKEFGIVPVGLGARDTLRLEMGFCLYGHELSDDISPIEAGLAWVTKFNPEKNTPSKAIFEKQMAQGVSKKRIGLEMRDKGIARQGYELTDAEGRVIGSVTSGSISPMSKVGIAMGYVETAFAKPGMEIFVNIRDRKLKAEVVKMPFRK
ncbi:MAG: glycine cleavage system aminomethyltransferase GcvT [Bacteroidales bacterium]|nr:glycine cleavage system aminomethyltransferase GcvT [Bacteroidales bacterium]